MATKKSAESKGSSIYDEFEPTSTKALKKIIDEEDQEFTHGRGDRIELSDGVNKIRFWPKRKGEESFYKMRGCHWYKILDPSSNDEVNKVVPDARIHAGMEKDISEIYIDHVAENLDSNDAADSRKIKKVSGNSFNGGLQPNITWIAYASHIRNGKLTKVGEFEFKKTVRDALNSEMVVEDEDEAIETDPFTSPKDGRYVQITYNSKAKKNTDYYKVRVSDNKCPISAEELEAFKKMTPISKLDIFNYSIQDFETSLEGLRYYDEQEEINLFETEEFQALVKDYRKELIKKLKEDGKVSDDDDLPFKEDGEDEDEASKSKKSKPAKGKPAKQKEEEPEDEEEDSEESDEDESEGEDEDQFEGMDREELKQYKVDNNLDIKIFKSDSDDDIRNKIRAAVAESEESEEEDDAEEPEEEQDKKSKNAEAKTGGKGKMTLDDIKKKLGSKK